MVAYATREDVARATDTELGDRDAFRIDRAIESASRAVDDLCHRRFYPETDSRTVMLDKFATRWAYLGVNELIGSPTSVTDDGTAVTDYTLHPQDAADLGHPYTRIEFESAPSADEVVINGLFGYSETLTNVGALAANISSTTATTMVLGAAPRAGIGQAYKINGEYVTITDAAFVDTTENLAGALTANKSDNAFALSGTYAVGEVLLIGSEQMLVTALSSTGVIVRRAYNGTFETTHSIGADVEVRRSFTITRGQLGSTATTHTSADTVYRVDAPPQVRDLTIAYAVDTLAQERAAYARKGGTGDQEFNLHTPALRDLEKRVKGAYGRIRKTAPVRMNTR